MPMGKIIFPLLICGLLAGVALGDAATQPANSQAPATQPAFNSLEMVDPNPMVRLKAVRELEKNDPQLRTYDHQLVISALGDVDPNVRGAALSVLADIYTEWGQGGPLAGATLTQDAVIKTLTKALDDPDYRVATSAARALARFGSKAAAALPKIGALLEDSQFAAVTLPLAEAIDAIDRSGKTLDTELTGKAPVQAKLAVIELFSIDRDMPQAPLIATFLSSDEADLRRAAIMAMLRMRQRSPAVLDKISAMVADTDARVRAVALMYVSIVGSRSQLQAAVDALMGDKSPLVRSAVGMARRRLGQLPEFPTTGPAAN